MRRKISYILTQISLPPFDAEKRYDSHHMNEKLPKSDLIKIEIAQVEANQISIKGRLKPKKLPISYWYQKLGIFAIMVLCERFVGG